MNHMDPNRDMLNEIFKMTKENNQMLHAMRRNAFIGGIFRYLIWILLFIVAPYILYTMYLAPVIEQMNSTITQIQGTGAKAQAQLGSFQEMWSQLQDKLPGFMQNASSTEN